MSSHDNQHSKNEVGSRDDYNFEEVKLVDLEGQNWIRCDENVDFSSQRHAKLNEYLSSNLIESILDEEELEFGEIKIERFLSADGSAYLEVDRQYRKVWRN